MYFNAFILAVIALTPLKFPLSSCMMCLSTPCYSTLAESIMGSSQHAGPSPKHAYVERRADGTVIFLLCVLCCCLVLSHIIYFLHKVSLAQLFLIPVVEFQRAQLAPPICHLGEET